MGCAVCYPIGVFSVAENPLATAKPFGEAGSIKNNKLCKTNPISEKPKMNLTFYSTKDYENKSGLLTTVKQTQSNPILSASACPPPADSKGLGQSGILSVEGVRQFFERAAGAFGFGSAKFFANFYEKCVILIEKLRILRQIRLE